MTKKTKKERKQAEIKAALEMQDNFDDWIAKFMPNQALEFVQKCQIYNRISREGLLQLVERCIAETPKNKLASKSLWFEIGNESSLVIYVHYFKPYTSLSELGWEALANGILEDTKADEKGFHLNNPQELVLRFWWD